MMGQIKQRCPLLSAQLQYIRSSFRQYRSKWIDSNHPNLNWWFNLRFKTEERLKTQQQSQFIVHPKTTFSLAISDEIKQKKKSEHGSRKKCHIYKNAINFMIGQLTLIRRCTKYVWDDISPLR